MINSSTPWPARVENVLDRCLSPEISASNRLHQAMRYACLGGGKRLRAQLVYATGSLLGVALEHLDACAAAVELIHAYSLVHDDLPAMDNDDLRRGKATVHIAFDQATAILAGDALQCLAFNTLAKADLPAETKIDVIQILAHAAGAEGMCAGQQLDMDATKNTINHTALQQLHALKTGALITACVAMAARIAHIDAPRSTALKQFAQDLGLAFQIQDDILDVESCTEQLGKSAGKDLAQAKATYPALLGLAASKQLLEHLTHGMHETLQIFGVAAQPLIALAEFSVQRKN